MNFTCNLKKLNKAITNVCLAINKKINPIPVLEGILLECENNELKLTGFDLNLAIIKTIEIETKMNGKAVLNAQLLSEILKKMKGPQVLINCDENFKTTISDDETKFKISGIDSKQFPKIFDVENINKIKIKNSVLKKMIFQSTFATAQIPGQNPILCGTMFKIENENLKLISLDGYRIAISKRKINNFNLNSSFVVSNKALNEIFKLLNDDENENNETEIEFNNKYAVFKIHGYKILTRLLEGEFLNYSSAIPKICNTTLTLNSQDFTNRIERVSVMVTNRISVILKIENSKVKLTCESTLGKVTDLFKAKVKGTELEKIAFNFKYMLDALKHTQCEKIKILFKDELSPIKIIPLENDEFLFLILPVRT